MSVLRFESEDELRRETAKRRDRFNSGSRGRLYTPERLVLAAVLELLKRHPKVAFAYRTQAGVLRSLDDEARRIRVGFRGLADIVGALRPRPGEAAGRWLAVECKSDRGRVSAEQSAFLQMVRAIGGVAVVAYSVDDVMEALA